MDNQNIDERFTEWDPVEELKNDEAIALYLLACLEDDPGDGSLVKAAFTDIARARGMSSLAEKFSHHSN